MVTVLVFVAVVVVAVLAARRWLLPRQPVSPRDQVEAFTRARAVTTRWSADPGTTPDPLKAYLAEQATAHAHEESQA